MGLSSIAGSRLAGYEPASSGLQLRRVDIRKSPATDLCLKGGLSSYSATVGFVDPGNDVNSQKVRNYMDTCRNMDNYSNLEICCRFESRGLSSSFFSQQRNQAVP